MFVVTDSMPKISGAKVTEELVELDITQIIPDAEILYQNKKIYRLPVREPEAWDEIYESGGVRFCFKKCKTEEFDRFWIQLEEKDEDEVEDFAVGSPLDFSSMTM